MIPRPTATSVVLGDLRCASPAVPRQILRVPLTFAGCITNQRLLLERFYSEGGRLATPEVARGVQVFHLLNLQKIGQEHAFTAVAMSVRVEVDRIAAAHVGVGDDNNYSASIDCFHDMPCAGSAIGHKLRELLIG